MRMRTKLMLLFLLAGSSMFGAPRVFGGAGFGGGYGYAPAPVAVYAPAPAPAYEYVAPAPAPGYAWVNGYWYPAGPRYVWRPGYWARPSYARVYWVRPY